MPTRSQRKPNIYDMDRIDQIRRDVPISVSALARSCGVNPYTITQNGGFTSPTLSNKTCVKLIEALGLDPADYEKDPSTTPTSDDGEKRPGAAPTPSAPARRRRRRRRPPE